MNLGKKIVSALIVTIMFIAILYAGKAVKKEEEENIFDNTPTLHIWYTDEALTDYLGSMAVKYNERYQIRIIPTLQSGLEFLETINQASLSEENTPDLFIATNDLIEKAFLTGLAMPVDNMDGAVSLENFPESAIHAVSYQQQIMGYPFYYETSALLYNKTYLRDLAKQQVLEELKQQQEAEAAASSEETALEETVAEETQQEESAEETKTEAESKKDAEDESVKKETTEEQAEETAEGKSTEEEASETEESIEETIGLPEEELNLLIEERVLELIPDTFEELLQFADSYDAPENVEAVFKWDVADIFYNYFFVGNYIDAGGMSGDSLNSFDIYNENAIRALMVYQDLSDYFAIDAETVDYASVINEFMEGKVVMTTATTDIVSKLEAAREEQEFQYEYGIATIPRLTEEMETKGMSVTNAIYINGYSNLKEEANRFARFLAFDYAGELYEATGKVTANRGVAHTNKNLNMFMNEYQDSVPVPKVMAASNLLIKMEIMFDRIWNGEDVSKELQKLSEDMMSQITGEPYQEDYIRVKEEEKEYLEYSDE